MDWTPESLKDLSPVALVSDCFTSQSSYSFWILENDRFPDRRSMNQEPEKNILRTNPQNRAGFGAYAKESFECD